MKKTVVDIKHAPKFEKQLLKAPLDIKHAFRQRIALFLTDQHYPLLHNHLLTGNFLGFRSINVTGDWRALYKEVQLDDDNVIVEFHLLGTHSQLYR